MSLGPPINHNQPDGTNTITPIMEAVAEAKLYTGVDYYPKLAGFVVQFRHKGDREYFGPYLTAEDAGDAYDHMHKLIGNDKKPSYKGPPKNFDDDDQEFDF